MNNLLDRLRKLPRSTQILGAVLGLVLLGTVGYLVFFPPVPPVPDVVLTPTPQPTQTQPPTTSPPTDTTTLKPLEAPGIPFLANQSPSTPEATEDGQSSTVVVATPAFRTPPNPFAPLDEPPVTSTVAVSNPPTGSQITPTPIPTTPTTVVVQQPSTPLPSTPVPPTIPAAQPRLSPISAQPAIQLPSQVAPSSGALPLTLNPLDRQAAVVPPPPPPPPDNTASTNGTGSTASTGGTDSTSSGTSTPEPPASPLTQIIQQRSLKLTGVALGPTGVAIISSQQGDMVVSVGERLPGTNVLLKSLEARQAVLALGEETQTLKLEGGE